MNTGKNLNDNEFGNRDIPPFPKAEFPFKGVGHFGSQYVSWDTPQMRALWQRELNKLYRETFRKMPPDVWRAFSRTLGMYRPNFLFESQIFVIPEAFRP